MFTPKNIVKSLTLCGLLLFAGEAARAESTAKSKTVSKSALTYEKCTAANGYFQRSVIQNPIQDGLRSLKDAALVAERTERSCPTCAFTWDPFKSIQDQFTFLNQKVHPLRQPSEQDLKCVQAAQMTYSGGSYASCSGTKSDLQKGLSRPCVSESYVDLTTRAFNLVAACTKVPRREAYALFLQESGMHINPLSHTGAGGIGQLTKVAILGVQQIDKSSVTSTEVKTVSKAIAESIQNTPGCAPLKPYENLVLTDDQAARRCQILSFPRNPLYPMTLSFKHYLYGKTQLRTMISRLGLKSRFGEEKLADLEAELAQYAYNAGVSGIGSSFLVYARTAKAKQAKSVDAYMKGFQEYLAEYFSEKKSRSEEVSNHVRGNRDDRGVRNRLKAMDKKGGVACFAD